jgi:hemerythrin-like domain-containing protein
MQRTLDMMRDRQRAMSSTLLAIRTIARRSLKAGTPPDFTPLRRLLAYLERHSQAQHQPAEERHLFRALEAREPAAKRGLHRARRDHAACLGYLNRLSEAMGRWERGDQKAGGEVAIFADDYVRFCRLHGRIEARDVLPLAARALTPADWSAVAAGLAAAKDPLAGSRSRADCAAALATLT